MTAILLRTSIIYVLLILAMRLMGKRQIGELEVSELVITLLISEVASLPITDSEIPVSHAVIPIIALLFFEVSTSVISVKLPKLKNILTARPTTLIKNGKISQKAMSDSRITTDELIAELRHQGITDISEVFYAILETNGKITIIQKEKFKAPTLEQMNINSQEKGIYHIVIDKGAVNSNSLSELGITEAELAKTLSKEGVNAKDIYLMMINDSGETQIIPKDEVGQK